MKTVALIGFGQSDPKQVPETADERWGMNTAYGLEHHTLTRIFELHSRAWLRKHYATLYRTGGTYHRHVGNLADAATKGTRVVTWEPWDDIPSEAYPKQKVDALTEHPWHASSADWMVALAIAEGFKRISLHGIDFGPMDQGEPWAAFGALSYWVGVAEGRGAKVSCEGGTLFTVLQWTRSRSLLYGYHDVDNMIDVP